MAFLLWSFIRPSLTKLCKAKIVTQRLFNDPIEYYEFACLWAPRARARAQAADKFDSPSTMAASLLHSCRTYATYPLIFASAQNNCMLFCAFRGRALCACVVRAWRVQRDLRSSLFHLLWEMKWNPESGRFSVSNINILCFLIAIKLE